MSFLRRDRFPRPFRGIALVLAVAGFGCALLTPRDARAQACCAGASGLTPAWLTNHESALVGAQLRLSETHSDYPTRGTFYSSLPERDAKIETDLFASVRFLPRGQISALMPIIDTRRRSGGVVEQRIAPGDGTIIGRYDLVRAGESSIPGIALLAGTQLPFGPPPDKSKGLLGANVTGIGAFEFDGGASVEQTFGHVILHATALVGYRLPREVLGLAQHLGLHALYLVAGGWVFDDDASLLFTVTHVSEGDATVAGKLSPDTGWRTTQLAMLVVAPLTDTLRMRVSLFTDVPPLGVNHQAMGGTALSLLKSWL